MKTSVYERFRQVLCKITPAKLYDDKKASATTSTANILAFFVFGTFTFFNQELLYTAAEDILSGRKLPTPSIFVTFITPLMAVKVLFPWFIQKVSYLIKTLVITICMMAGILLIVYANDTKLKLVGIALNAMATGTSELVFLSLTTFYPHICISAFVAGTGMSSLVAPLYYTGVTTWNCVSPKTAILITAPWSILIPIFYAILDKEPMLSSSYAITSMSKQHDMAYKKIDSEDSDEADEFTEFKKGSSQEPSEVDCGEKMRIGWKIIPFIVPLILSFFAEYLSNSAVVTTISFPKSGILPRDHYLYYSLSYRVGKFFGRSYLFMVSCCTDVSRLLTYRHTWIFALINLIQLVLLMLESWYHFIPNIWLVIMVCSTLGLVSGLIVLHSPHAVASVTDPREREFAFGFLTVGNAIGAFIAGLVGLAVEPYLTKECTLHFHTTQQFCFTRHRNVTGWSTNIHC